MKYIIKESENIILRKTKVEDLEFVINAERQKENAQYIGQWPKDQHTNSLVNKDILHIIIEESATQKPIGYLIISGIENKNNSIEFRRFVICEKGTGFGKGTLKLVKKLSFNDLKAHRLWLDVRVKNIRAQNIYKSEGFKEDGVLRECIFYNNKYESLIVMSILKNEY
ncbi:GNAT family N-acetyltransferase [Clostridium sardiniense]|uniref:GNAT family N-acetyltransferase n=1 Tax=Clostridium sardiniense TaxID=29369 RepID=UPI00195D8FFC|nr:GNAT family protein [Clostridium sardiniense]MBM7835053.1 RimJ/RimL family protein N-acetyltransferase [Clostridium sardiniense]